MKKGLGKYLRNDIESLTPGRATAQASHASNAFIHKHGNNPMVKEWQKQTKQGFGTAIVLSVNESQIGIINSVLPKKHCLFDLVYDPDYIIKITKEVANLLHENYEAKFCSFKFYYDDNDNPSIIRTETTCAYVFGSKKELEPILKKYPLYG